MWPLRNLRGFIEKILEPTLIGHIVFVKRFLNSQKKSIRLFWLECINAQTLMCSKNFCDLYGYKTIQLITFEDFLHKVELEMFYLFNLFPSHGYNRLQTDFFWIFLTRALSQQSFAFFEVFQGLLLLFPLIKCSSFYEVNHLCLFYFNDAAAQH